jgi:hypothetical protein
MSCQRASQSVVQLQLRNRRGMTVRAVWIILFAFLVAAPAVAQRATLTDQQVAEILIRESRQAYYATGHPCACPEDLARNGNRCGGRSAYSRPGGAEPLCYLRDVTPAAIAAYRASH